MKNAIVWFRQDLRLADNPALVHAANEHQLIPVYIYDPESEGNWAPGAASRWWLHHSLKSLQRSLAKLGLPLIVASGNSQQALWRIAELCKSKTIFWNRRYEPLIMERDKLIKTFFEAEGFHVASFNASLLYEPWEIRNQKGDPYKVFSPFHRTLESKGLPKPPLGMPAGMRSSNIPAELIKMSDIDALDLLPTIPWDKEFYDCWRPGEDTALAIAENFIEERSTQYLEARNIPSIEGTSALSPHLHFGEISPRWLWSRFHEVHGNTCFDKKSSVYGYLREIVWREFAYHLLFHFPDTPERPLRQDFERFPWQSDAVSLSLWQKGLTGYPIVDAGMRQLWKTGWMHNRVRMIVASFLVKDLVISWREGAAWFWDTLVDADLASNTLGWQWAGGCGADAAPYFRIFNPILQGEKFDPDGTYIRKFIPELTKLPNSHLHKPWTLSESAWSALELDYPKPIVDHAKAREIALAAYSRMSQKKSR